MKNVNQFKKLECGDILVFSEPYENRSSHYLLVANNNINESFVYGYLFNNETILNFKVRVYYKNIVSIDFKKKDICVNCLLIPSCSIINYIQQCILNKGYIFYREHFYDN